MTDYLGVEQFPPRKHVDELSFESEVNLFEYHVEKSKRPFDWHFMEAQRISGSADIK